MVIRSAQTGSAPARGTFVVWITGLSGAGKTTLCEALYGRLKPSLPQLVKLDGDVVRKALSSDLGYGEADRRVQIGRIQGMTKILADQGISVLVGALYAHPALLQWNRDNLPGYVEVYLKASLDLLRDRDSKGLYAQADADNTGNIVGLDIQWHEPLQPDVVIDVDSGSSPQSMAKEIWNAIPSLNVNADE